MSAIPTIPGYTIKKELGQGGMARVYLAHEEKLERTVALKVLPPALAELPNATERFIREAKTSATLVHSNIVTIHDVGSYGDIYYMAMEFLEGGSLKDRVMHGPMDPCDALGIVRQVALALDYAHTRGYIHRDIKPDNIMFRKDGTAVVTDFGIARVVGSSTKLTKTGMSVGTPHYMSPEQARGRPLDGRSDLYSLGIMFHEMLTGHVPFDGEDSVAIAIKHIQEVSPRLPECCAQYQDLVDSLLAKDPDQRLPTGARLCEHIDGMLGGRPSPAGGIKVVSATTGRGTGVSGRRSGSGEPPPSSRDSKANHFITNAGMADQPTHGKRLHIALLLAVVLGILVISLVIVLSRSRVQPSVPQPATTISIAPIIREFHTPPPPEPIKPPNEAPLSGSVSAAGENIPQEPMKSQDTTFSEQAPPAQEVAPMVPRTREVGRDGKFIAYANGTVLDSNTNLMWAAQDNGSDISWDTAEMYCRQFNAGGYSDWRLPTISELESISAQSVEGNTNFHLTRLITLTGCCPWASETQGSDIAAYYTFFRSSEATSTRTFTNGKRALPVRSFLAGSH